MRTTLTTLFLICSLATAQAPSFTPFGTGCTLGSQTLAIGNQGLPRIGTTFRITYSGPNFTFNSGQQIAQPTLGLGFQALTTVLPQSLLPQQPAGCLGFIVPVAMVTTAMDPVLPQFDDFVDIVLPNDPGLVGVQVLAQWLTLFQQCGFAGCGLAAALTSDAAVATIGL